MKFKFKATRAEEIEVDIEFPAYRRLDLDFDGGSTVIFSRVEANGTVYSVHDKGDEFELEIKKYSPFTDITFGPGGDPDYIFGRGQYKSTEAEFNNAVKDAMAFMRRFPRCNEDDEIGRLRADNSRLRNELKDKIGSLEDQLAAAKKEAQRLEMIHADVRRDVEIYGIGFTVHIRGKGMDRLPPEVVSLKTEPPR
jgi:hypothetical protein